MKSPVAVDLFAGCGGMSLGVEAAGFNVGVAIEIDPTAALMYENNFPKTKMLCRDILSVSGYEIKFHLDNLGLKQEVDLLTGGSPCQGFSSIGKRDIDDPRNRLVFEFVRMIKELKPKYFIFENVPGILKGEQQKFFKELVSQCNQLGYQLSNNKPILNALNYGVAQSRKRVFIIGSREDMSVASHPKQLSSFFNVEQAIGDLEDVAAAYTEKDRIYDDRVKDPNAKHFLNCYKRFNVNGLTGHLISKHKQEIIDRFAAVEVGTTEPISRFYRLKPDGFSHTLRAGSSNKRGSHTAPRPIHYKHPRCISVREGARLHSYPDWFKFHQTIWHSFRAIGNSVPPLLAKAIAQEVLCKLQ